MLLADGATAQAAAGSVDRVIATAAVQLGRLPYALVRQAGPRRLWDEAAVAYRWWVQQGRPPIESWRWTVTSHRQRLGLA